MHASHSSLKSAMWLMIAVACASSMEFYAAKIWSAGQPPGFSDLYAPWWGSHELLLHNRNPYTAAVAHEIQAQIYGSPIADNHQGFDALAGGFAYPPYVAFLLWPTLRLSFARAQFYFPVIAAVLTLSSIFLWLQTVHFRGRPIEWLTFAVFALGSFPFLQAIHLRNLSAVAAAMLTFSLVLLCHDRLALAGLFLAVATFKPQFTVVLLPWLALWTLSNWRRRQNLAWSFLACMGLLLGASELLLPGWMGDFIRVAHAYTRYTFGRSLLDLWVTPHAGPFVAAGLLFAVLVMCWKFRSTQTDSPYFLPVISITLAATVVVIPTLAPHAQLLLLPGCVCLYRYHRILWNSAPIARLSVVALCLLPAWAWLAAVVFAVVSIASSVNALLHWWDAPLYTSPVLPLAVLFALCCLIRIPIKPADIKTSLPS